MGAQWCQVAQGLAYKVCTHLSSSLLGNGFCAVTMESSFVYLGLCMRDDAINAGHAVLRVKLCGAL
jgi:hypothetical protein